MSADRGSRARPVRIGVLAYPGCFASEIFGVPDLLTMAHHVAAARATSGPGGVTTTGAFSAMYDFALDLIGRQDGGDVARATARIALLDDARTSQTPYVDAALLPVGTGELSPGVKNWLDRHLAARYDLDALAATFHVSSRTLLRRFRAETGLTPLGYLQAARVQRARHLLETTDRTIASVADEVGYQDAGTFTTIFTRLTTQRPRDYRTTFRRHLAGTADPVADGREQPTR